MPLYEFECQTCGQISEILMKISDPMPSDCFCGKKNSLTKKMSRTSFVLKGQGWYETDFKSKPKEQGQQKNPKTEVKKEKTSPQPTKEAK